MPGLRRGLAPGLLWLLPPLVLLLLPRGAGGALATVRIGLRREGASSAASRGRRLAAAAEAESTQQQQSQQQQQQQQQQQRQQRQGRRGIPPGDVSAIDDIQKKLRDSRAAEVADQLGGVIAEKLENAAAETEEAVSDPVGTIGGAIESVADVLESGSIFAIPTAPPEAPEEVSAEAAEELEKYRAALATPPPADFNGVYCRGAACQYRIRAPPTAPPGSPEVALVPPELRVPELCRGLACPALPGDPAVASFVQNCTHLFQTLGRGLRGDDGSRTIGDVRDTFVALCGDLLPLEAGACRDYGDVLVAALAPEVNAPSVGGVAEACRGAFEFLEVVKHAEVRLRLTAAALAPPAPGGASAAAGASAASLLSAQRSPRARAAGQAVGTCSPSGLAWRTWWVRRHPGVVASTAVGGAAPGALAQLRAGSGGSVTEGKYNPNPPCEQGYNEVPRADIKYQVVPPSPDGSVPPVEVQGGLFMHCVDQMKEITLGYSQTAPMTVQMTRDWCGFQSMIPDLADPDGFPRHPEWNFRSCTGMAQLVAFALRKELGSPSGLGALEICKRVFLASGVLHRVDRIIREAWTLAERSPPAGGLEPPGADDPEQRSLVEAATKYAEEVYARLREQKQAAEAVSEAKALVNAWAGGANDAAT